MKLQELKEHAEHGSNESALRPVAFTMSVLAVLVAIMTVLGHRTHTEAVLDQNKATDQWNQYQVKENSRLQHQPERPTCSNSLTVADKEKAARYFESTTADHQAKWNDDLKEDQEKAKTLEEKGRAAPRPVPIVSISAKRCSKSAL